MARLCSDVRTLCVEFLSAQDQKYLGDKWSELPVWYGAQNDLLDLLRLHKWNNSLVEQVKTVRSARFLVNRLRVKPCRLDRVQNAKVLAFLLRKRFWVSSGLWARAAAGGQVDVLRFGVSQDRMPFEADVGLLCAALQSGSLECVTFVHEGLGVLWFEHTVLSGSRINQLKYARQCNTSAVIARGHVEIVKYMVARGCSLPTEGCDIAAECGHLPTLEFLVSAGCAVTTSTLEALMRSDQASMLRLLHEKGYNWDETTCALAAKHGAIECLRYAHEKGCPWDERTCLNAAVAGRWTALRYACDNGCEVGLATVHAVFRKLSRRMITYFIDGDFPWEPRCYDVLIEHDQYFLVAHARSKGKPFDAAVRAAAAARGADMLALFDASH